MFEIQVPHPQSSPFSGPEQPRNPTMGSLPPEQPGPAPAGALPFGDPTGKRPSCPSQKESASTAQYRAQLLSHWGVDLAQERRPDERPIEAEGNKEGSPRDERTIDERPLDKLILHASPDKEDPDKITKNPENFATYEEWIQSFSDLPTFKTSDGLQNTKNVNHHQAVGIKPGSNKQENNEAQSGKGKFAQYIQHPDDTWLNENLSPELIQVAYKLPADCADMVLVLRHVWLYAHKRTESYNGWKIGLGVESDEINELITTQVDTKNIDQLVSPYVDRNGSPMRKFLELESVLHPGDILIWNHSKSDKHGKFVRISGHAMTIANIERDGDCKIKKITALQGNQPLSESVAKAIHKKHPTEDVDKLRGASGHRIESQDMKIDKDLPIDRSTGIWTIPNGAGEKTELVMAGSANSSPDIVSITKDDTNAASKLEGYISVLESANDTNILQNVLEKILHEIRITIEMNGGISPQLVENIGNALGRKFKALSIKLRDDTNNKDEVYSNMYNMIKAFGRIGTGKTRIDKQEQTNPPCQRIVANEEIDIVFSVLAQSFATSASTEEPSVGRQADEDKTPMEKPSSAGDQHPSAPER